MDIIEVGEALYCLNKEAKNIRDVVYKLSGQSRSPNKKIVDKVIMDVLNLSKEEYKLKLEDDDFIKFANNSKKHFLRSAKEKIILELKIKQEELYKLKDKVITKALDTILPEGKHNFIYKGKDGLYCGKSYYYIIIGEHGFHFSGGYYKDEKMRILGRKQGKYKKKTAIWDDYEWEKIIGTIEGEIKSDYTVKFTEEMKKILEEYIEQ